MLNPYTELYIEWFNHLFGELSTLLFPCHASQLQLRKVKREMTLGWGYGAVLKRALRLTCARFFGESNGSGCFNLN